MHEIFAEGEVMQTSEYSDSYLKEAGKDAPQLTEQVLRAIVSPLDLSA